MKKKRIFSRIFSVFVLTALLMSGFSFNSSALTTDRIAVWGTVESSIKLSSSYAGYATLLPEENVTLDYEVALPDFAGLNLKDMCTSSKDSPNMHLYSLDFYNYRLGFYKQLGVSNLGYKAKDQMNCNYLSNALAVHHCFRWDSSNEIPSFDIDVTRKDKNSTDDIESDYISEDGQMKYRLRCYTVNDPRVLEYSVLIAELDDQVQDLTLENAVHESTIERLRTTVSELEATIDSLESDIEGYLLEISYLNTEILNLNDTVSNSNAVRSLFNGIADGTMSFFTPIFGLSIGDFSVGNVLAICIVAGVVFILLKIFRG